MPENPRLGTGPAQLIDGPGRPQATATLAPGYVEMEYLLAGSAGTYHGAATGPASPTGGRQEYVTRILVRAPSDPAAASDRVVIEPFNTSNGPDSDVIWSHVSPLLQAEGDAWVGVSVRASSADALVAEDPSRYEDVSIPTNDVAWDMLGHLGALLKHGGPDSPLGDRAVRYVYLSGYSQSGADTATFAMAVHPLTRMDDETPVFDGYFPAAHSSSLTPLVSDTANLPRFEQAAMVPVDVPVVNIETQCDVEGFRVALRSGRIYASAGGATIRRDDNDAPEDRFRLYEVAGAPHSSWIPGCEGDPSSFPTSAFVRSALRRLFEWVEEGIAPPMAPRIELTTLDEVSVSALDDHGNARGGVRSPFVDVPLLRYDVHCAGSARCMLVGSETPLPAEVLSARYRDAATYVALFTERLDETIAAGFLLQQDRAEIIATQAARASALLP